MSPVAIIVAGPDRDRAASGLGIAAAAAALGRDAALLFDRASVPVLPLVMDELATALALGVRVSACATGLADLGVTPPAGVETSGVLAFLAANPDAQLLAV